MPLSWWTDCTPIVACTWLTAAVASITARYAAADVKDRLGADRACSAMCLSAAQGSSPGVGSPRVSGGWGGLPACSGMAKGGGTPLPASRGKS
eukprot:16451867-Heterocapsa_arctica.AAC.2